MKKPSIPTLISYLVGIFILVVVFLFAVLTEQDGTWTFVWPNAVRCIPFFFIYLVSEIWLYPQYVRTNRLRRYVLSSFVLVVLVSAMWSFVCIPLFPAPQHHSPRPVGRVIPEQEYAAKVRQWVAEDSLAAAQLADSCAYYHRPAHPDSEPPKPPHHPFPMMLVMSFAFCAFFTSIHFLLRIIQTDAQCKEAERMRAEAELKQLRYQVNPHFLMNTLNNIHALIEIDTEAAQESVRLLSKMMRYMLYDTDNEKVELVKELDFLSFYFQLMRKRYIDEVEIVYEFPKEIPAAQIPPAILVNLAENCFKHGISYSQHSYVRFDLRIENDQICCRIVNSRFAENATPTSGLGVDNIRKRLDILYPKSYVYQVVETENEYQVELKIPMR